MSTYIKLSTKEYPRHIGDIEIDPAGMDDYAPLVFTERPAFNSETHYCALGPAEEIDGVWQSTFVITQIPYDQCAQTTRAKRNVLLSNSDWTQLADAPVDKTVWAIYRQALRDVPAQAGFPWEIQWPVEP